MKMKDLNKSYDLPSYSFLHFLQLFNKKSLAWHARIFYLKASPTKGQNTLSNPTK